MSCVVSPVFVLQPASAIASPPTPSPARLLSSFNTWAFKREQPSDVAHLQAQITAAIHDGAPISFVLYWGKGPRNIAAGPDVACLEFLAGMLRRIEAVYAPGALMTLIFTDTHAALNGHASRDCMSYFSSIASNLEPRRFRSVMLSEIVRSAGATAHSEAPADPACIDRLVRSAERWFRGGGSPREGAERYLLANNVERRAVEIVFPGAIFTTFNGSEFDFLFPSALPRFYMYSLRKGWSVKPWFMAAGGEAIAAAS